MTDGEGIDMMGRIGVPRPDLLQKRPRLLHRLGTGTDAEKP